MNGQRTALLLFLAGALFRAFHFQVFGGWLVVGPDQMQNILLAKKFAQGDFYGVLDVYWTPFYPILIGVLTYFIDSLVLPSVIISTIAGGLAAPVTYWLVKQSYGSEREAVIAGALAVFYPHLINSFFAIGTENIYLLLVMGALLIGWNALQKNFLRDFFLTGVLLGLAYLTRPEAFAYPFFFALLAFGKQLQGRRETIGRFFQRIAVLMLGFALLAAPYLFYLKHETGGWTISGKAAVNSVVGEPKEDLSGAEESFSSGEETAFEFDSAGSIVKYFALNLFTIHKNFIVLVPLFLLMLVALGLFDKAWSRERFEREIYLILFFLLTVVGYASAVVQTRYFYVVLPIFFGWMARGIIRTEKWLRATTIRIAAPEKSIHPVSFRAFAILALLMIYFYTFPLNFFLRTKGEAYEERDAGLWLKENSKVRQPLVFSASRRPAFYAEAKQLPPTTTNLEKVLADIKNCRADYVITSERSLKRNPYLKGLDKLLENSPEFELVYEAKEPPEYKIMIFKLK